MPGERPPRPTLVYDGDCGFCTSAARALARIGPAAAVVPWQHADLAALGIAEEQAAAAVQWAGPGGRRSGHEAIAAVLMSAGQPWKALGRVLLAPGISPIAARAYRLVADNRYRLPGGTPACALKGSGDRRS